MAQPPVLAKAFIMALLLIAVVPGAAATQAVGERGRRGKAKGGKAPCDTELVPVSMPGATSGVAQWEMCIHPPEQDIYLSKLLKQGTVFDPQVQEAIARVTAMHANRSSASPPPSPPPPSQPRKPCFVDVGGNIGTFSLYAAALGYRTFTFEPLPRNYQRLLASREHNQFLDMKVYSAAASDSVSTVDLYMWAGNFGSVFIPTGDDDPRLARGEVTYVGSSVTVPLGQLLTPDKFPFIQLMKMDCEGHEEHALRGALSLFASHRVGTLVVEVQPSPHAGSEHPLFQILKFGYQSFSLPSYKPVSRAKLTRLLQNNAMGDRFELMVTLHGSLLHA